jgi:hypothetical protein
MEWAGRRESVIEESGVEFLHVELLAVLRDDYLGR